MQLLYMHTGAHESWYVHYIQVSELAIRHVKHLIVALQMNIQLLQPHKYLFYLSFRRGH